MIELDDFYHILIDNYNQQRVQALKKIATCSWISSAVKKEITDIISDNSEQVQEWIEHYKAHFSDKRDRIGEYAINEMRWRERMMMFRAAGSGLNYYGKKLFLWAGINKAWAEYCWDIDKKTAIDALVVAICHLAKLGSIEDYRKLLKVEKEVRLNRRTSSAKGGNAVAELAALIRGEAIRLLNQNKPDGAVWRSRREAVESIESELWQFIESKKKEGCNIKLKRISLNEAVQRWARKHKDIKLVFECTVKKQIGKK
ncbi:hypothetical protein [Providencia sp. PROV132]|uniref:hypothetical protein n=1 Tax=Providencia sp. PROV132 TaxID=2949842 RepID=UPI00234BC612|nr:hypothetical protein [Providencia sp. PROV132]